MTKAIQLLGISGSLRKASYSTAILRGLADAVASKASLRIFLLDEIPPYNGDLEGEHLPKSVAALKQAIAESDGLVISSPEYNYGTSGVLKNAIDWASRPGMNSPLKGKPVLLIASSPGATGGARAHYQLRESFAATLSRVIARAQVTIIGVADKVKDGKLVDKAALDFASAGVDDLIAEVNLLRGAA